MGYSVKIPNGILSISVAHFNCPKCNYLYLEKDYYNALAKSKSFLIYKTCKNCKNKIGITTSITGDVVVWLKKNEIKVKMKK